MGVLCYARSATHSLFAAARAAGSSRCRDTTTIRPANVRPTSHQPRECSNATPKPRADGACWTITRGVWWVAPTTLWTTPAPPPPTRHTDPMDLPWPTRRIPDGARDEWLDHLADQAAVD